MHRPPDACTISPSPPGTVVTLHDARVFSHHGVIIDAENRLRYDLSPDLINPPESHRILNYPSLPDPTTVTERVFSLATPSSQKSYFHWLIDALPRLRHLDLAHFDHFLTPLALPFHAETLTRVGISPDRWLEAGERTHLRCSSLGAVSPLPLGSLDPDDLAFLRGLFPTPAGSPHRRIYLSRGDSWRRRILNEDQLLALLAPLGFETIHCADLSVAEQARLTSEAEIILAPHGAALTNLIFAPSGCKIIELLSDNYLFPYYQDLANLCGLPYQRHVSPNPSKGPDHAMDLESFTRDVLPNLKERA